MSAGFDAAELPRSRAPIDRRRVLLSAIGIAMAGLAACDDEEATAPPGAVGGSPTAHDVRLASLAAAMEGLNVAAYTAALSRAESGKAGKVPTVVTASLQAARRQHADHAAAWNSTLAAASRPAVSSTALRTAGATMSELDKTDSATDLARFVLRLEEQAAQTYAVIISGVTNQRYISVAATILPIEQMHTAIIRLLLGEYPVPAAFLATDRALKADALTG